MFCESFKRGHDMVDMEVHVTEDGKIIEIYPDESTNI